MTNASDHLHALSGAYAVDALEPGERDAFAHHLTRCAGCAQDVREFTATAARLGSAVALAPPPDMRTAVLSRIETVRQLPPTRRGMVTLRRRALPLALAACLAAGLAGGVALGGAELWPRAESGRSAQALQDLAAVITAPDARTVSGRSADGAAGSVVVSARQGRAVFLGSGLPAAPAGKTYQLWFADGSAMRPAGLLSGDGGVLMTGSPGGATAVGVTLEPAGGSDRPTTAPMMLLTL
ncbi:anti-sigma factor domain-containing protein [Streptomyces sp. NPDC058655]|uniref:anti-sigma factor n=1 Tax=Streptomyces sp. NPDC058655 TaxID=3346577 RepID=UPI003648A5D2